MNRLIAEISLFFKCVVLGKVPNQGLYSLMLCLCATVPPCGDMTPSQDPLGSSTYHHHYHHQQHHQHHHQHHHPQPHPHHQQHPHQEPPPGLTRLDPQGFDMDPFRQGLTPPQMPGDHMNPYGEDANTTRALCNVTLHLQLSNLGNTGALRKVTLHLQFNQLTEAFNSCNQIHFANYFYIHLKNSFKWIHVWYLKWNAVKKILHLK